MFFFFLFHFFLVVISCDSLVARLKIMRGNARGIVLNCRFIRDECALSFSCFSNREWCCERANCARSIRYDAIKTAISRSLCHITSLFSEFL